MSAVARTLLREVTHDERLKVASQICGLILEKYQDAVLTVCVSGSTAKKLDRPYSDLEILCVVRDGLDMPKKKYYLQNGLLVDIDYPQESNFLKAAREIGWDWPLQADQYRNRIVLFEREGWLRKLDQAVAQNDKTDLAEPLRIAALAMTESLAAVYNAHLKADLLDLRTRAFYFAWDTARVIYLLNRRYVLTTSWVWKQALECPVKPDDFTELVQKLVGTKASGADELLQAAEKLYRETLEIVRSREIAIETENLSV